MDAPPTDRDSDTGIKAAAPEPALPVPGVGEHDWWGQVCADLERAVAPIRRDARRLHLPASEIDDAVQDALCHAWLKRDEHDAARPLIPWLRGFGRRAILARLMARSIIENPGVPEPASIVGHREPSPDERVEARESGDRMRILVATAPSRYREVLLARYWAGLRISEVANTFGQSPKIIRRRLSRALGWLDMGWRRAWKPTVARVDAKTLLESAGQNPPPPR